MSQYGDKGTRKYNKYNTGATLKQNVTLMDEWAVSDETKTVKQATEVFTVYYIESTSIKQKMKYDGYIYVEKIN